VSLLHSKLHYWFLSFYSYLRDLVGDTLAVKSDEVLRSRVKMATP
jgi:hypothetical protein